MTELSTCPPDDSEPTFSGYPPGCPVVDAIYADGSAFRMVLSNPPTLEDFKSQFELGMEPRPNSTERARCRWRALSIYRNVEDARHHKKKYAHKFGNAFIAAGKLTKRKGKTLHTPPPPPETERQSHTEWWCADGTDRLEGFHVIE